MGESRIEHKNTQLTQNTKKHLIAVTSDRRFFVCLFVLLKLYRDLHSKFADMHICPAHPHVA